MPETVGAIVGFVGDLVAPAAEAAAPAAADALGFAGDVGATAVPDVIGSAVPGVTAAAGEPLVGEAGGQLISGLGLDVTAPAAGIDAALAGDPTAAALAGEGAIAGAAGGGEVAGVDAALAGAGLLAGARGLGALGGGGAGTLTSPITAGVPSGTGAGAGAVSAGAATPSDVLGGTQLALNAPNVPVTDAGGGGLGGASDIFNTGTTPTPFTGQTLGGGFPQQAGGAGTGGVFDFSPSTMQATGYPGAPQLAPQANIPASTADVPAPGSTSTGGTPLTQTGALATFEGNVPTEANQNIGGNFGEPTPQTPAGGGATSGLGSVLRTAGLLAPLGALGLTLARGQPGVSPATQTALNQTAPFSSYAQTQIQAAQANQITPAQAANIATYVQNQTNQLYQMYAREGRDPTNDSDYIQGVGQIQQQALAMQAQYIQDMVNNAIAAQGVSDSVLQTAATEQVANDNAFQQALTSSVQSFGLVAAINTLGTKAA